MRYDKPLYILSNQVIDGIKRGSKIGFPTANLPYTKKDEKNLEFGVYAVKVIIGKKKYTGVVNVGIPLTFHEEMARIDVHILDFSGDLYSSKITVEFWKRLRDVKRFRNEQELIWQIEDDIKFTQKFFSKMNSHG